MDTIININTYQCKNNVDTLNFLHKLPFLEVYEYVKKDSNYLDGIVIFFKEIDKKKTIFKKRLVIFSGLLKNRIDVIIKEKEFNEEIFEIKPIIKHKFFFKKDIYFEILEDKSIMLTCLNQELPIDLIPFIY